MPLADHLFADLNLSNAEKSQLTLIERAAAQSLIRRIIDLAGAAVVPGIFLAMYAYFLHQAPRAGLALCKLHGTFYIPETGALEKLLRYPIGILALTVVLWIGTLWHLQSQRRLVHRILSHVNTRSNVA